MMGVISIIIPTLNEEKELPQTLTQLDGVENKEVIVVDGGSDDATVEIAKTHGARVLSSPKGRGVQLNRGVEASSGEILLFLHGDTRLPDKFAHLIHKTMIRENCAAGAFSLGIDSPRTSLAIIAYCANLRSRLLQMPYGDQGIFTSRNMYDRVGGFAEVAIMEDYIFVQSMKQFGKIFILDETALTSARRWQNIGVIRTTLINQLIVLGYSCGVKLPTLASWYQRLKGLGRK
jgi:rSAM/selenodomain-associated transferase 2